MSEIKKCPKCKKKKGKFLYSNSSVRTLNKTKYAQRGRIDFYKCQNCGHEWSLFKTNNGPLWTLPMED